MFSFARWQNCSRHKSRRTLCQGRTVRTCVHSVGMLCGYMPNSSLNVTCAMLSLSLSLSHSLSPYERNNRSSSVRRCLPVRVCRMLAGSGCINAFPLHRRSIIPVFSAVNVVVKCQFRI